LSKHDPVSTPRSSNRTCGSPASGSRTRQHARACDALHGARHFPEFIGLPQSPCPCRCPRRLEPGPLPSTGVTRLHQYYEPLRHPAEPGLALTGLRLVIGSPSDRASRVASVFLLCVLSPLPRRNDQVHVSLTSPALSAFLPLGRSRLPHHAFRGLLSVHSRYGPHIRRVAIPPFTPEASAASLPPRLLQLLPAGAKVAGWDSHPLKDRALARRTPTSTLTGRRGAKRRGYPTASPLLGAPLEPMYR